MPKRFSTARGREFGDGLRAAIARAGFTSRALAEILDWDEAKLSDLINGKGGTTEVELGILLGVLRVPPQERDHLLALFHVTGVRGWLQEHGPVGPILPRTLITHEHLAKDVVVWQPMWIHGLLQLPAYAQALFEANSNVPAEEVGERIRVRNERQRILGMGVKAVFYIHESALRKPVGGKEVMRAQLEHLERMSTRRNIVIRIVPNSVGAHPGQAGAFTLMRFHKIEPVVFVESDTSMLIVEAPSSVKGYDAVLESLALTALDEEQSRRLIKEIAAEY